jgi:putative exporter of polyketide antibiotics
MWSLLVLGVSYLLRGVGDVIETWVTWLSPLGWAEKVLAVTQLFIAIIATGYAVQAVGNLRSEETAGRLEPRLSGTLSRTRWLAVHGLVIIVAVSSVVLATATAWSMGTAVHLGRVVGAGAAYLPAELLVGGLELTLFGLWPRAFPAAWAAFAFIAFLGPGLKLAGWVLDLSPTTHVGNPPLGAVAAQLLFIFSIIAAVLGAAAAVGFRRRGCLRGEPRGPVGRPKQTEFNSSHVAIADAGSRASRMPESSVGWCWLRRDAR